MKDFSLKEGEKLTIAIKGVTGKTAAAPKKLGGLGGLKKLAPPKSSGGVSSGPNPFANNPTAIQKPED
jgi:hypothetical protein